MRENLRWSDAQPLTAADLRFASGPYRVVDFKVDTHVFLEANRHFNGPPPSIERIEIRRYADDAALVRSAGTSARPSRNTDAYPAQARPRSARRADGLVLPGLGRPRETVE